MKQILMLAAENGALPGGKVGGIGDVVRDVPKALAKRGLDVTVLTPAYGVFSGLPGAKKIGSSNVNFGTDNTSFDFYEIPNNSSGKTVGKETKGSVRHIVIEHPLFSLCGTGQIYCDDPPERPFASDASKFSLLCTCAADMICNGALGDIDVLHLHDWHAAFLLILREFEPCFKKLKEFHCVYTIHNLALQGIRPYDFDESSLHRWYPALQIEPDVLRDPRWPECINPMAIGIRLADKVHAVSPSYAEEILSPSNVEQRGLFGGEGLEADLRRAKNEKRLIGILNGCEYYRGGRSKKPRRDKLLIHLRRQLRQWQKEDKSRRHIHQLAHSRIDRITESGKILVTSIGRLTEQKIGLMRQKTRDGKPSLHQVLEELAGNGTLIMLGSGDPAIEEFLFDTAKQFESFLFVRGYSDQLSEALYRSGDLFFMPSSFEPCGISQMLALRAGQPCLVHHVGGLRDTVAEGETGFVFTGENPVEQASELVSTFARALAVFQQYPARWQTLRDTAAAQRFRWSDSVSSYIKYLYQ